MVPLYDDSAVHLDWRGQRSSQQHIDLALYQRQRDAAGRHIVKVTKRRKNVDFARMVRDIARAYPHAATIHLVMDNLSTHTKKALADTFGESEADKLWSRFTVHYTPIHASWLNQAEIQIGVFARQCIGRRRISSMDELKREAAAWRRAANRKKLKIRWKFTVRDARKKFGYSRRHGKIHLSGN